MADLHALFVSALALSFAFCAHPGAVTTEAFRRGLRGSRPVLFFELGAFGGGAAWAVFSLAGAAALGELWWVRLLLTGAGALLMLRMAAHALARTCRVALPDRPASRASGDFGAGMLLALANPFAAVFWLGAASELHVGGVAELGAERLAAILAGFVLGSVAFRVALVGLIVWGRRFVSAATVRYLNAISALLLTYFGMRLILHTVALVGA
jgi:threonine/homoserine/homoserine lactone efflux protein